MIKSLSVNFNPAPKFRSSHYALASGGSRAWVLPNFPNPFNPETWIPYQLATDASVSINIYNVRGQIIRTLSLGTKSAGIYLSKDKAAYWDGNDNFGQRVASGVYYYGLQAGGFLATRKMVILK